MMLYLLFAILSYTMASIIVEQKIFQELREWLETCATTETGYLRKKLCQLIKCHFCTGFWCGFFLTLSGFNVFTIGFFDPFYGALFGAFSGYMGYTLMQMYYVFLNKMGVSDDNL